MQFGVSGNVQDKTYNPSDLGIMNYAYNMTRAIPLYGEDGELYTYKKGNYPFNIIREMESLIIQLIRGMRVRMHKSSIVLQMHSS